MKTALIKDDLPLLRRYARALAGSQKRGDERVRLTLEALIENPEVIQADGTHRQALYALFHQVEDRLVGSLGASNIGDPVEQAVQARLETVSRRGRQLLLLTSLENFSLQDAAQIIGLTFLQAKRALEEAYSEIEAQSRTSVMIIEDEQLIAMELENLVDKLGHEVVGNATTRQQAIELFHQKKPGLILADVQLADNSSGIDAVNEILQIGPVPVIFITAFPERLLTGTRPEPTYLITKPFNEKIVQIAISQAAFLGTTELPQIVV